MLQIIAINPRHQVFDGIAKCGHGSIGDYGFKLHLVINDEIGVLAVKVTAGNVNDQYLIYVDL